MLPEDYVWEKEGLLNRAAGGVLYAVTAVAAFIYCRIILRIRIKGMEKLRRHKGQGYFVFGNHTQEVSDALLPVLVCAPKHIYTIVSPANLGIPLLGRLLPYIGALPVPSRLHDMKALNAAVLNKISRGGAVIIYPEAHLWPYCTMIRPFERGCFKYPVVSGVPSFTLTTTYQKRKKGGKPRMTVFVDGPFYPDREDTTDSIASVRKETESLSRKVRNAMLSHKDDNTDNYITYIKTC